MTFLNRLKDNFTSTTPPETGHVSFELPMPSVHQDHIAASKYLFVLMDSDGFSERLLSKFVFVDPAFCYEVNFRSFGKSNLSQERIQAVVKGQLPQSIKKLLSDLLQTPDLSTKLKTTYTEQIMTDAGQTYYSFNLKNGVVQVNDRPYVTDENKIRFNLTELKFVEFARELDVWSEKMYSLFVNEI